MTTNMLKCSYLGFYCLLSLLMTANCLPVGAKPLARNRPYEQKTLVEGDMVFVASSEPSGRGVAARGSSVPWTNGIVPYEIYPGSYTPSEIAFIENTMRKMERIIAMNNVTCIQFRPRISSDPYYITIINSAGCWSYVGQNTGVNMIRYVSFQNPGCLFEAIIMHEFLHTLGFFHEQSRPDRDSYVRVNYANIQTGMAHNFDKYNNTVVDTLNTSYDYASVMHYERDAFSSNGLATIEPLTPGIAIGQRDNLSNIDILEVRLFYRCSASGVTLPAVTTTTTPNIMNYVNTTASSSLTMASPVYIRHLPSAIANFSYGAFTVVATISGTYFFGSDSGMDMFGYLYDGPFDANVSITNVVNWDDDSGGNSQFKFSYILRANATYILIATTFSPGVFGAYTVYVSGPALVALNVMSPNAFTTSTTLSPTSMNATLTMATTIGTTTIGTTTRTAGGNGTTTGRTTTVAAASACDSIMTGVHLMFTIGPLLFSIIGHRHYFE